jgi:hypothetical protein
MGDLQGERNGANLICTLGFVLQDQKDNQARLKESIGYH